MISLPPGATISRPIKIVVDKLTDDMIDWYKLIGGEIIIPEEYDYKGKKLYKPRVRYKTGKYSYWLQDGSGNVLLHFNENDATIVTMFLAKFLDNVKSHNISNDYIY